MPEENKKKVRANFREWSAGGMLFFGCGLTVAGFCVPPLGDISQTVILVFSQCLIYAGSALGIDIIVKKNIENLKK